MATGKEIRFGVEGRAAMLKGVDLLADAVQVSFICWNVVEIPVAMMCVVHTL